MLSEWPLRIRHKTGYVAIVKSGSGCSDGDLNSRPWWAGGSIRVWLVGREAVDVAHRTDRVTDRHLHALTRPIRRWTLLPGQHRQRPTALPAPRDQLLLAAQIRYRLLGIGVLALPTSLRRLQPGPQRCNTVNHAAAIWYVCRRSHPRTRVRGVPPAAIRPGRTGEHFPSPPSGTPAGTKLTGSGTPSW